MSKESVTRARGYLLKSLSKFPHKLRKIDLTEDGDGEESDLSEANCITSKIDAPDNLHTVMIDLDVPARLVPSSTPGHSHLYIDVPVTKEELMDILYSLSMARIVQPGYASASMRRGFSTLRLPWVHKEEKDVTS